MKTAQLSIQKSGNAGSKVSRGNVSLISRAYAFTVQILIIQRKTQLSFLHGFEMLSNSGTFH